MQTKSIVETMSEQQKATLRTGLFCSELKIESFHSSECFLPVLEEICWVCHIRLLCVFSRWHQFPLLKKVKSRWTNSLGKMDASFHMLTNVFH